MKEIIKVYSHPRSGTHFLEAFLSRNIYKGINLSSEEPIYYGHWSNKIFLKDGEPYHKLFGSHFFPDDLHLKTEEKKIYIFRDGRAVIYSIWKSNFFHKSMEGISFSDFLRAPIDWYGGLGNQKECDLNIVQHWHKHVERWHQVQDKNLLIIRYEDLKNNPKDTLFQIFKKFYLGYYILNKFKFTTNILNKVDDLVGLKPNAGLVDSWKSAFSKKDIDFFFEQLPSNSFLFDDLN